MHDTPAPPAPSRRRSAGRTRPSTSLDVEGPMLITDDAGSILAVSSEAASLLGMTCRCLAGQPIDRIFAGDASTTCGTRVLCRGSANRRVDVHVRRLERDRLAWLLDDGGATDRHADRLRDQLDHELRNKLGSILHLIDLVTASGAEPREIAAELHGYVHAMVVAHEIAVRSDPEHDLPDIVRRIVGGAACDAGADVAFGGDPAALATRAISPLCLALHELARSAHRLGALRAGGAVQIVWRTDDAGVLHLEWTERAAAELPRGSKELSPLLRGWIEHELRGTIELVTRARGRVVRLALPIVEHDARRAA